MLTPIEFNKLTFHQKHSLVPWEEAEYIDERSVNGKFKIELYKLYDFYVDAWFLIGQQEASDFKIIDDDELINYYCEDIDISELLE